MPLAEETGLIVPIGAWVLRTACGQLRAWRGAGYPAMHVAVNFSARQFQDEDLALVVAAILEQSDLAPRFLEIEITESDILKNPARAQSLLKEFTELGVRIALDDFGTGYSSLNHLRSFPGASIKIDRSFVRNVCTERHDAAIVRSLIVMAHNLNLKVIAEGVETAEQLAFLRDNACDAIQGFLVSHPVPAEEITPELLATAPGAAALEAIADRIDGRLSRRTTRIGTDWHPPSRGAAPDAGAGVGRRPRPSCARPWPGRAPRLRAGSGRPAIRRRETAPTPIAGIEQAELAAGPLPQTVRLCPIRSAPAIASPRSVSRHDDREALLGIARERAALADRTSIRPASDTDPLGREVAAPGRRCRQRPHGSSISRDKSGHRLGRRERGAAQLGVESPPVGDRRTARALLARGNRDHASLSLAGGCGSLHGRRPALGGGRSSAPRSTMLSPVDRAVRRPHANHRAQPIDLGSDRQPDRDAGRRPACNVRHECAGTTRRQRTNGAGIGHAATPFCCRMPRMQPSVLIVITSAVSNRMPYSASAAITSSMWRRLSQLRTVAGLAVVGEGVTGSRRVRANSSSSFMTTLSRGRSGLRWIARRRCSAEDLVAHGRGPALRARSRAG